MLEHPFPFYSKIEIYNFLLLNVLLNLDGNNALAESARAFSKLFVEDTFKVFFCFLV